VLAGMKNERPTVWTSVAMHADVAIKLALYDDEDGAAISFGPDGPDVCIEFADLASLERLAAVIEDGVRQLRSR
jgi:hypothetical protein